MPRHKQVPEAKLLNILKNAGILPVDPETDQKEGEGLPSFNERLETIAQLVAKAKQKPKTHMNFFVMYDIQDHKMRRKVANYLEEKGCYRVQKSIFLAELHRDTFKEIYEALAVIKEEYGNDDSLLLLPLSEDDLNSMKIIGKNIDFDTALTRHNTMIF